LPPTPENLDKAETPRAAPLLNLPKERVVFLVVLSNLLTSLLVLDIPLLKLST